MNFDFDTKLILDDSNVRLEVLSKSNSEELYYISSQNPELLKYSPSQFSNRSLFEEYIDQALKSKADGSRYPFIIYDKSTEQFAGSTSFGNISNKDKRLEIGWTWIGLPFQRTGLNRRCKFLLLSYAFETLGFERVEFKTDSRNHQSRTAIEGIGASYEGELRSHTIMSDGFRRNTIYYSILKEEWPSIKGRIFKS